MGNKIKENERVERYLDEITTSIQQILGDHLTGLYLHGSAVQSDFRESMSDIDIIGIVAGQLSKAQQADLTSSLSHNARPVPVAGLEFILCTAETVREPTLDFQFAFALSTGANWPTVYEPAGTANDTLIDLELCRQSGRVLTGPPVEQIFGPVARDLLCTALIEELQWHRRNLLNPADILAGENAVLNGARSVYAAETGRILSKTEGGRWWLEQHGPDSLVAQALASRGKRQTDSLSLARTRAFLDHTMQLIKGFQS